MQKTNVNTTALAIFFVATAVIVIGGLAVIPLTTTTAMAEKPKFWYCARGATGIECEPTQELCEILREGKGIEGHCHPEPIRGK